MATYSNMQLEDYLPYKEARASLPICIYGPAPFHPSNCICGRYIVDDFCICATSCTTTSKAQWAKENPEAYKAEQVQQVKWLKIWYHWQTQYSGVQTLIHNSLFQYVCDFEQLRDQESHIGCYKCQKNYLQYCECNYCDACGDKYCGGCHPDDED